MLFSPLTLWAQCLSSNSIYQDVSIRAFPIIGLNELTTPRSLSSYFSKGVFVMNDVHEFRSCFTPPLLQANSGNLHYLRCLFLGEWGCSSPRVSQYESQRWKAPNPMDPLQWLKQHNGGISHPLTNLTLPSIAEQIDAFQYINTYVLGLYDTN